jgi:hypothetical protein
MAFQTRSRKRPSSIIAVGSGSRNACAVTSPKRQRGGFGFDGGKKNRTTRKGRKQARKVEAGAALALPACRGKKRQARQDLRST